MILILRKFQICLIAISLGSSISLYAQQELYNEKIDLLRGLKDRREPFPIVNDVDSSVSLFLMDNITINCLQFNKNFELIEKLTPNRPKGKFKFILGGNPVDNRRYNLFFTNEERNEFLGLVIDYENRMWVGKPVKLRLLLEKEKFIGSFTYNNKFIVVTTSIFG